MDRAAKERAKKIFDAAKAKAESALQWTKRLLVRGLAVVGALYILSIFYPRTADSFRMEFGSALAGVVSLLKTQPQEQQQQDATIVREMPDVARPNTEPKRRQSRPEPDGLLIDFPFIGTMEVPYNAPLFEFSLDSVSYILKLQKPKKGTAEYRFAVVSRRR